MVEVNRRYGIKRPAVQSKKLASFFGGERKCVKSSMKVQSGICIPIFFVGGNTCICVYDRAAMSTVRRWSWKRQEKPVLPQPRWMKRETKSTRTFRSTCLQLHGILTKTTPHSSIKRTGMIKVSTPMLGTNVVSKHSRLLLFERYTEKVSRKKSP